MEEAVKKIYQMERMTLKMSRRESILLHTSRKAEDKVIIIMIL